MSSKGSDFLIKSLTPPSDIDQLISEIENEKYIQQEDPIQLFSKNQVCYGSSFTQISSASSFQSSTSFQESQNKKSKMKKIKKQGIKTKCKNALPNTKNLIMKFFQKHGYTNPAFETFLKSQCSLKVFSDLFKDLEARLILSRMFDTRYLKRQYLQTRCKNQNKVNHMFRLRELGKLFVMLEEVV